MSPDRGQVWYAELGPVRGHEQDGYRPVLVLSAPRRIPFAVALVIPLTSRYRNVPSHLPLYPPEGGVRQPSYLLCEHVRSLSYSRFGRQIGTVREETLAEVSRMLRILLMIRCPRPRRRRFAAPRRRRYRR
jgi:mRNA interferase MazF